MLAVGLIDFAYSQNTTSYGTFPGTLGTDNSNFGYIAGSGGTSSTEGTTNFGYQIGSLSEGDKNTFMGSAFSNNDTGSNNAFFGFLAGSANTSGSYNTFIGYGAGSTNSTGSYNTAIGEIGGPTTGNLSNTTTVLGFTTASNQVRIGHTSPSSIGGQVGWTNLSDGRFKKEIRFDVPGLELIMGLQPVSYYIDYPKLHQFLFAEDNDEGGRLDAANRLISEVTSKRTVGFLAQDVEQMLVSKQWNFHIINEAKNNRDYFSIDYGKFTLPLIVSIQELNHKIRLSESTLQYHKLILTRLLIEDGRFNSQADLLTDHSADFADLTDVIQGLNASSGELVIYDRNGKSVLSADIEKLANYNFPIEDLNLNIGVYTYVLLNQVGILATGTLNTY